MQPQNFMPDQKRSFWGPFDQWKTHRNKCVECQGDYFEENQHFIHLLFLFVINSVLILFEHKFNLDTF